jgi:hypothetical protein
VISAAIEHGRRHFDEVPVLVALGKAAPFLSTAAQVAVTARLADRVRKYVGERPMLADPRRIQLVLELLTFMDEGTASALAEGLFDAKKAEAHVNILTLSMITPYLKDSRRDDAINQIRMWARNIEWSISELSGLRSVQNWLSKAEHEATVKRFYDAARKDDNDRLVARNLASFLPLIPEDNREALGEQLLTMASAADDWDESWSHVMATIIAECEMPWLSMRVHPFLSALALRSPEATPKLLIRLGARADLAKRTELVDEALASYPLSAWPIETVIELVPLLRGNRQVSVLAGILRELSTQRRVRQIHALEALFPTIETVGGEKTMVAIWECIWEVTQWWP